MFYETRVLDAYGNLKKTISPQELQTRHWKIFQQLEERTVFQQKKGSSRPGRKKGKKDESLLVAH
ncbi:MAG: hypothetical protein HN472_11010 [Nitrospina sp.]|jgi:hypothetical protein|nr:hypothetical protein [Nitrospina sp.]MBT3510055.1 hypothetical protein [Nitrospina sp.]MBT3877300.1 hypothetical protein [Nitrospina sp.]MBT4046829.1 hypothetical protein [Nitrospina sp.]MBT4557449.1 hypothetical protein [Nitrospina sp.]